MKYYDLTETQKDAMEQYREDMTKGFIIEERYPHYPDDNPGEGLYIEEQISTPWYFEKKPVDAYVDVNSSGRNDVCDVLQFLVDGLPLQTYVEINGDLKFKNGELTDKNGTSVTVEDATSTIESIALNGADVLAVPFYREFMLNESYLTGFHGEPQPTEQDYINNLAEWGDALTDPKITICGSVTDISELHEACESAPHFNNGKGGHGVVIPDKLKKYLEMGEQSRAKQAENALGGLDTNNTGNKTDIDFGD